MSEFRRVYIDANILILIFERSDEISVLLTDFFFRVAPANEPFLVTSELTLAETLVHPLRHSQEALAETYEQWLQNNDIMAVGKVTRDLLYQAAFLRARYTKLKLPDAIHLATAIHYGCSHFLSDDDRVSGDYEFADLQSAPFDTRTKITSVRPKVPLLQSLISALP